MQSGKTENLKKSVYEHVTTGCRVFGRSWIRTRFIIQPLFLGSAVDSMATKNSRSCMPELLHSSINFSKHSQPFTPIGLFFVERHWISCKPFFPMRTETETVEVRTNNRVLRERSKSRQWWKPCCQQRSISLVLSNFCDHWLNMQIWESLDYFPRENSIESTIHDPLRWILKVDLNRRKSCTDLCCVSLEWYLEGEEHGHWEGIRRRRWPSSDGKL